MLDNERAIWSAFIVLAILFIAIWATRLERELPDINGDCRPGWARNIPINDDGDWCYPVRITD